MRNIELFSQRSGCLTYIERMFVNQGGLAQIRTQPCQSSEFFTGKKRLAVFGQQASWRRYHGGGPAMFKLASGQFKDTPERIGRFTQSRRNP